MITSEIHRVGISLLRLGLHLNGRNTTAWNGPCTWEDNAYELRYVHQARVVESFLHVITCSVRARDANASGTI